MEKDINENSWWVVVHAPRKEWRNRLPIKIQYTYAPSSQKALELFIPLDGEHYNKPFAKLPYEVLIL